jgi:hypothetical protein
MCRWDDQYDVTSAQSLASHLSALALVLEVMFAKVCGSLAEESRRLWPVACRH